MTRNALSILLLIAVIFAALWMLDSPPAQFQSRPQVDESKSVLAKYIDNVETIQFDTQGLQEHYVKAARVEHRIHNLDQDNEIGQALLNSPDVLLLREGVPYWHIQAKNGESTLGDERINLTEDVQIKQLTAVNGWTMTTSSLWIEPDNQIAHTDDLVELKSTGIVSKGIGMNANFNDETIEVLADTETIYELAK